jgi:hypothetical protein
MEVSASRDALQAAIVLFVYRVLKPSRAMVAFLRFECLPRLAYLASSCFVASLKPTQHNHLA